MDCFYCWNTVLLYEYEVMFFIDYYVFCFVVFSSFHLEDDYFAFFGEKDLDLFLFEFRPFEKTSSKFFDSRLASCGLMSSVFNFFEHEIYNKQ